MKFYTLVALMVFSLVQGQQKMDYIYTQDSLKIEKLYALAKEYSNRKPYIAKEYLYQVVSYIDSIVGLRKQKNNYFNKRKADAYHFLSYYERREHNFDEAAILAQKSINIKLEEGLDTLLAISYHQKAKAWISVINSMDDGIRQLKIAEKVAKKYNQTDQLLEIYSSLGSAYGVKKDTIIAMKYYNKSIHLVNAIGTDYQKAAMYSNYSAILRRFNDYKGNLPYLKKAIELHKKNKNKIGLESGLYALGIHYAETGNPQKGVLYLNKAIALCMELKSDAVLPFRYLALSRSYKGLGNYEESYNTYVKYHKLLEKRNDVEEAKKLTKLETVFMFKKQKAIDSLKFVTEKRSLELIKDKEGAKKQLYFLLFIITVLLGILISIWLKRYYKEKNQLVVANFEKKESELKAFTNELLQKIEEQEQQIKNSIQEKEESYINKKLHVSVAERILTKEDWYNFREKFNKAYPLFFRKIQDKGIKLTNSEERLVSLEKLGLDNNQIAKVLGISLDSVFVSRYRLRKKISAPKEISLIEYLS
ncbi:hypothetical protein [Tenacibaculum aiptasiae]|uniref:hypothetical protein n=2 Tax=Tenacibaculum aiptasiae TaxID=426481 RepID=UPI00232DC3A7|nr:hypothetical protein [Tenacibaculum aiptasiae]